MGTGSRCANLRVRWATPSFTLILGPVISRYRRHSSAQTKHHVKELRAQTHRVMRLPGCSEQSTGCSSVPPSLPPPGSMIQLSKTNEPLIMVPYNLVLSTKIHSVQIKDLNVRAESVRILDDPTITPSLQRHCGQGRQGQIPSPRWFQEG